MIGIHRMLCAGALLALAGAGRGQERAVVVIDVPFLAQTEDLCGGAAAAMVLRYWGEGDVQAEDFSSLVDRSKGGITTGDLVQSLKSKGFVANPINATAPDIIHEIDRGRPVVALIDGGGERLHYVVIVAWAKGRVLFHDPSIGPFRVKTEAEFLSLWRVTENWALVLTQGAKAPIAPAPAPTPAPETPPGPCDPLIDRAIVVARGSDPELAVPSLMAATAMCPEGARAVAALAGVRFRQERWAEAADFARQATDRDAKDPDSWRLRATSLYLAEERMQALQAWNRIDEPRIDRVEIEGLIRTRQDVATAVLGLRPRDVLTPARLTLALRRLGQMPTSSGAKVTYRPSRGGRADIVASAGEGPLIEPWRILFVRLSIEAAARRETGLQINSPTGRGETLEIGGRFAARRPSMWASLETPRFAGLPGVVSLRGLWDRQTYRPGGSPETQAAVETRRLGAIDWSHWTTASLRTELGAGVDRFDGRGTFFSFRGGVESRVADDRLALAMDAGRWTTKGDGRGFAEGGVALAFRSHVRPERFVVQLRMDARRATEDAPRALWPGAGTGPGRPFLLRGSKLVRQGELVGDAFGRGLLHATVEAEVRAVERGTARVGIALFSDWARPWDTTLQSGPGRGIFSMGVGLRLRVLATAAFRLDVAKRVDRGGLVLSAGVIPPWPR
jgi:predicted double-glycine peptidase